MRLTPSGRLEALELLYVPVSQIPLSAAPAASVERLSEDAISSLDVPEVLRGPEVAGRSEAPGLVS
jgi:hypothetical protein